MRFSLKTKPVLFAFLSLPFLSLLASGCKPMCPIETCHVRMVHRHGKAEYRGSKWYKKQNPKIGEKLPKPTIEGTEPHNDKSRMRK